MRKRTAIGLSVILLLLVSVKIYTDNMPDYGLKTSWKRMVLGTLLSDDVPKISVADALAQKEKLLFLDTRSKAEFNVSHLEGAQFAGYKEFDEAVLREIPKNQPIVVYCSIGKRSDEIGKKLLDAGFVNVKNLYGGIFEWINKGYTVVDQNNQPTLNVHAYNHLWGAWLTRGKKLYR